MPRRSVQIPSFTEVLTAAIADLLAYGFDSVERVDRWTRDLRLAAERSLASPAAVEEKLRQGLAAVYRRMVDRGGIIRYNPGIARFTIEKVRPLLRSELDRRIMASANLIKLNREQAIEKTLQRFSGWSTSLPKGGSTAENRRAISADMRKALRSLAFETRRVLIDQGHKMTAALSEIVATDGGAIAGRWRSNWRQPGYDYREDHKERDGQVYLVRDSWAHRAGLVRKGRAGYYDEVTAVGQEVFCRCYMVWLYNVRDLPDEMVTQKGRRSLVEAGMGAIGTAAFARSDSEPAPGLLSHSEAEYVASWSNKPTRCVRCSMFVPGDGGLAGNRCTAVEGDISAHGHCRLFEMIGARTRSTVPVPVDRDHDVVWMAVLSRDGRKLFVDRTVPRTAWIKGKAADVDRILWAHESGEWMLIQRMLAAFLARFLREPSAAERAAIYDYAHEHGGIPAERAEAKRLGVDWNMWAAWSRNELARLARRRIEPPRVERPPPDPHVVPSPGDARQPMAA